MRRFRYIMRVCGMGCCIRRGDFQQWTLEVKVVVRVASRCARYDLCSEVRTADEW